ncbi:MAG: DUF4293 domain-containing protein [Bacteroidia bacterium]|nr:DUF4293 domain-containing protein [Bacteroidia bacterium]
MLQRVQTLFLSLIIVISVLLPFVPFQLISTYETSYVVNMRIWNLGPNIKSIIYIPFTLNALIFALTLFTIFKFKNRPLQMLLCRIIAFTSGAVIACFFSLTYIQLTDSKDVVMNYTLMAFLPGLNILLAYISKKFIKNDEELVKSADRIR